MLCFNKDNVSSDSRSLGFSPDHQNADSYLNHSLGGMMTVGELRGYNLQTGTEHMRQRIHGRGGRDLCQRNSGDRRHELGGNCTEHSW